MYKVAIADTVYTKFQSYIVWLNDMGADMDYGNYLIKVNSSDLEFIKSVSVDRILISMIDIKYDIAYGNELRSNGSAARFRIFEFESEAHYHWFLLRWT